MLINASAHATPLPDKYVHCIMTSSPYYVLRKYSGDQGIDWPPVTYCPYPSLGPITIEAMKASLGLEPTPESFIGHLILIWRELYRVLRDDGVCWAVIGDSFSAKRSYQVEQTKWLGMLDNLGSMSVPSGLKQGDLMMIPHRFALALQGDGWLIRNDVVWAKKNPMPESVRGPRWERHRLKVAKTSHEDALVARAAEMGASRARAGLDARTERGAVDGWEDCPGCPKCEKNDGLILKKGSWRHTRAHEYIFQIVKKMGYWSNQEIIREPLARPKEALRKTPAVFGGADKHSGYSTRKHSGNKYDKVLPGRNPRSVLTTPTANYKGAHYATFPTRLVRSLIKSSTPLRCCPACGKGWSPIVKREGETPRDKLAQRGPSGYADAQPRNPQGLDYAGGHGRNLVDITIKGYRPTCNCGLFESVPGTVFDPFIGSGTVGVVAIEEGLNWIGLDLSFDYLNEHAKVRTNNIQLRLGEL